MATASVVAGVTVLALGLLFPPKVKSPTKSSGEVADQKSKEGEPQPFVYGIARPIGGNVIYQSEPIKVIKKEKVSGGGKGGSKKQTQKVEYIYRYYAIRVCRGPNIEYRRIWRNGKLAYDASATDKEQIDNNKLFLKQTKLYSGSFEQMPCPVLEGRLGVGNVPGYRGLAYMVVEYEDLTNVSGAIPQYVFEVARPPSGYTLTSKLYPYLTSDYIGNIEYEFSANIRNKVRKIGVLERIEIKKYSLASKHNGVAKPENDFSVGNFDYEFSGGVRSSTIKYSFDDGVSNFNYGFSASVRSKTNKTNFKDSLSDFNYSFSGGVKDKTIKLYPDNDAISNFNYSFSAKIQKG